MPSLPETGNKPQPVPQELNLPDAFPTLPAPIRERFGRHAEQFDEEVRSFWTRTRRILADMHFEVAAPVNQVKDDTSNIRKEFVAADSTLSAEFNEALALKVNAAEAEVIATTAISASIASGTAGTIGALVATEAAARAQSDGFLAGHYALKVVAGNVVTGMMITSQSGPGTEVSDITFHTDNFKVVKSGASVAMVDLSANGFIFGTDILSSNFVSGTSGWRLNRTGNFEMNGGTIRSTLQSTNYVAGLTGWQLTAAGSIDLRNAVIGSSGSGGDYVSITSAGLQVGANAATGIVKISNNGGVPYLNLRYNGNVFGSWSVTSTKSAAQWSDNAGNAVNVDGAGAVSVFGPAGNYGLSVTNKALVSGDLECFGNIHAGGPAGGVGSKGIRYNNGAGNAIALIWNGANVKVYVDGTVQGTIPNP